MTIFRTVYIPVDVEVEIGDLMQENTPENDAEIEDLICEAASEKFSGDYGIVISPKHFIFFED